jgi:signal transduction histidine kinase/HD-like signal output (HDOD) protein
VKKGYFELMQLRKTISNQLSTLKHLPTLPHILLQLIKVCNTENGSLKDISSIIEKDPALTGKILKLVNSAYFAPPRKIARVDDAVGLLGTNAVKNIAICSSVHEVFHKASQNALFNMKTFWWHSLRCAILARLLSKSARLNDPDEAFLSGMLHDIGKVVLWVNFPKQYAELLTAYQDRPDLVIAGETQMGATHAEVGAWLLERWSFQSFIADAVLYHHYPLSRILDALPLVKLIYAADALTGESNQRMEEGFEAASELFGLARTPVEELLAQTDGELLDVAESLDIEIERQVPKETPQSESDREKRKILTQEVRDRSLLLGVLENLLGAGDEQAILKESYQGLQTLFDVNRVLFFVHEAESNSLHGFTLPEEKNFSLVNDVIVPLQMERSLLTACLRTRMFTDSFTRSGDSVPAILDEQIIHFFGKEGLFCLPMFAHGEQVGVIVLGLDQVEYSHLVTQIKLLKMFADQVGLALYVHVLRRSQLSRIQSERAGASSSMARRVVHEVNNPLSIIKNYLKILGTRLAAQDMAQDEIRIINEEIDRVAQILRELAAFSEDRVRRVEALDVNELLSYLAKITRESLNYFNIKLHLELDPALPTVLADKNSLKQVFINLIKNASEAMTEGGNLHIQTRHISSRLGGGLAYSELEYPGYAEIAIADDGPGIPDDFKARLFEPYVTTKGENHSGLGLSIVHSIIKGLNGSISCESEPGKGTAFKIGLPIAGDEKG